MNQQTEKTCTKCKEQKSFDSFLKDKRGSLGLVATCKACRKTYFARYRVKNIDELKLKEANYRSEHKDEAKSYRDSHKDESKAYGESYKKSDQGKAARKRYEDKYQNALKSRDHYGYHKRKIKVLNHCETCNSTNRVEAHHNDYDLPMEVKFLCNSCHVEWHKINTPLNRETGIFTKEES